MAADDENAASQLLDSNNLTKYKTAAEIANRVLAHVVTLCVPDADIGTICESGDKMIDDECAKVYKNPEKDSEGKKVQVSKGVAFPTCVSVNNCVCHFSPLRSEPPSALKEGDVVKIDLGVHVGGFPAPVATTLVVGASSANPVTGSKADVILAAYYAAEAAIRMLKPENKVHGHSHAVSSLLLNARAIATFESGLLPDHEQPRIKNTMVTEVIKEVASTYKVVPVENMVSYQVSKDKIDDGKNIIQNPSDEQKQQYKSEAFDVNEVYAIDILCSTGNGKAIPRESRTTVFKRTGATYQLKMKTSRAVLSEIASKFTTMPFSLRALEDEKKARMGVVECQSHGLVDAYPVMYEKDGSFVAQFKSTAIISKNGIVRITSPVFDVEAYKSEHKIEDEKLTALLAEELGSKKKATKKKPAKTEGDKPEA